MNRPDGHLLDLLTPSARVALAGSAPLALAQVLEQARSLARRLDEGAGIAPCDAVLLADPDPAGFLLGFCALLLLDAVPVPLDPRTGSAALRSVLAQARPAAGLLGADVPQETRELIAAEALVVEIPAAPGQGDPPPTPAGEARPVRGGDDTALVLFTSGSTGRPKGVMLSHRNVLASVAAILDYLPVRAVPHSAVVLPLHYGYALVGQLLCTLAVGGRVTFLGPLRFPHAMVQALDGLGPCGLSSVPTSLSRLCAAAEEEGVILDQVAYLGSAGARLPAALPGRLRAVFPGARLFNQYGCTEASPRVSFVEDDDPRFAAGSVGRAIRGLDLAVLLPGGERAAPGQDGEIGIRGPNVSAGYLGDPEGSAAARRAGYLLTGDVGRLDPEGHLFLSGRRDRLVKCAGERVSLDEVEAALLAHPSVRDAAALAEEDPLLGARVTALVAGDEARRGELLSHLGRTLGPARRPARIHYLDALPRSSSGKVQREALVQACRAAEGRQGAEVAS